MTTILITIYLFVASLIEALAHFGIISTSFGQPQTHVGKFGNRLYHVAFATMWAVLATTLIFADSGTWKYVVLFGLFRLTIFNWFLNHLIKSNFDTNRPIWHLSDKGLDGFVKSRIGEPLWFLITLVVLISYVIGLIWTA